MTGPAVNLVGISHKTAPLARRERFAFPTATCREILSRSAAETLILVTCNRTELYGLAGAATLESNLLAAANAGQGPFYVREGREAVEHLYEVAGGLDSMVLGEPQILGQVKRAMVMAREADRLGPVLDELTRRAVRVGRRIRGETGVGRGLPSIPKVATRMARLTLGELSGRSMLIIGSGKLGDLTAQTLQRAGAADIVVTNRHSESAERLAQSIGGQAESLGEIDRLLADADIVISCTSSQTPILDRQQLERVVRRRRSPQPLVIIDIAVPRDIEPTAREIEGVHLFDLDDLRGWSSEAVPRKAIDAARDIVAAEAQEFDVWLAGRSAVPTIRALRDRAERIVAAEVERAGPDDQETLRAFGRRVMNKLLHHPTARLKDRAASEGETYVDLARDLFALDLEFPDERGNGGRGSSG
jgi:glutamyl-tRNA reductase